MLHELPSRVGYSESFFPRVHLGWSELRSAVRGSIHVIDAPKGEVYDVGADPAERRNVIDRERRAYAELRDLARGIGAFQAPERVDAEEAKKLAALGYVSAGAEGTNGPPPDPKDVIGQLAELKAVQEQVTRGDYADAIATLSNLLAANPRWSDTSRPPVASRPPPARSRVRSPARPASTSTSTCRS